MSSGKRKKRIRKDWLLMSWLAAAAVALGRNVTSGPVLLIVGMIVGACFAALVGFLIGIPVLRLKGDYLAIVTLAFGEIIKGIFNNLYVGVDGSGLHISILSDTTNLAADGDLVIGGPWA